MIAMAGLAEAAIAVQIAVTWFGLFVIGGMSLLAFNTGSRWIHVTVLILATLFGILFVPWEIPFMSLTAEDREDPDFVLWFGRFKTLAFACYIVMAAVAVNFVQFFFRSRVPKTSTIGEMPNTDTRS